MESGSKYFIADSFTLESNDEGSIDGSSFSVSLGAEPMATLKVLQSDWRVELFMLIYDVESRFVSVLARK